MKKTFLLSIILVVSFLSCEKDNDFNNEVSQNNEVLQEVPDYSDTSKYLWNEKYQMYQVLDVNNTDDSNKESLIGASAKKITPDFPHVYHYQTTVHGDGWSVTSCYETIYNAHNHTYSEPIQIDCDDY